MHTTNNFMELVSNFIIKHQLQADASIRYMDLVSEVGELGKEIIKSTNYGKKDFSMTAQMADELGDCLFSLFALCHELNIDAQEALNHSLFKYEQRFAYKGDISSDQ